MVQSSAFPFAPGAQEAMSYARMIEAEDALATEISGWLERAAEADTAEEAEHGDRRGDEVPDCLKALYQVSLNETHGGDSEGEANRIQPWQTRRGLPWRLRRVSLPQRFEIPSRVVTLRRRDLGRPHISGNAPDMPPRGWLSAPPRLTTTSRERPNLPIGCDRVRHAILRARRVAFAGHAPDRPRLIDSEPRSPPPRG